jgi:FkbM family methyltransferase
VNLSDPWAIFSEFRDRDPDLPLLVLIARLLRWKLHRLLRAEPIVRLHGVSRMKLRASPGEHGIQAAIFLFRDAYEPSVRAAIDHYVKEGDHVYDIGANLGLWSLRMLERVGPTGRVCAFEPMPETAERLAQNIKLSGHTNAIVRSHALGEAAQELTLYVPDDLGRSSLAAESEKDKQIKVMVSRLDDVWKAQGRPDIRFIKIDVEGAEPLVFRGATAFFKELRPVICCEINLEKLANMGFAPSDVTAPLLELGYQAWTWSDKRRRLVAATNVVEINETCDLVFVPQFELT